MKLTTLLKEYLFLLLFFVAAVLYGFYNVNNDFDKVQFVKWFLVPSLLVHYLINSEKKNIIYITALVFSSVGDLVLNNQDETIQIVAVGCFLIFNLLIIVLVSIRIGVIKGRKLISTFVPLLIVFVSLTYFLFADYMKEKMPLITLYFMVLALLCSFSFYFLINKKTKQGVFFFIAAISFFLCNILKGFENYKQAGVLMKVLNISFYSLSHYLYYKAITSKKVNKLI